MYFGLKTTGNLSQQVPIKPIPVEIPSSSQKEVKIDTVPKAPSADSEVLKNSKPVAGASEPELEEAGRLVVEGICGSGCKPVGVDLISGGVTKGKNAFLYKVKWLDLGYESGPKKKCSYIHFIHDLEWKTYGSILISFSKDFEGKCSVDDSCFGCGKSNFKAELDNLGYTGLLPIEN